MAITDQELRAMIREAIARHTSGTPQRELQPAVSPAPPARVQGHGSHGLFAVISVGEECVIEPSRPCDHCGYCKSLGH